MIEVFQEDEMCGCQGKVAEESLVLVMGEVARRPRTKNRNIGGSKLPVKINIRDLAQMEPAPFSGNLITTSYL